MRRMLVLTCVGFSAPGAAAEPPAGTRDKSMYDVFATVGAYADARTQGVGGALRVAPTDRYALGMGLRFLAVESSLSSSLQVRDNELYSWSDPGTVFAVVNP